MSSTEAKDSAGASDGQGGNNVNKGCSLICSYLIPPLGVYWRFGCRYVRESNIALLHFADLYANLIIFPCIMLQ